MPLRDGDWAVMRLSRGQPASALENRVVLVEVDSVPAVPAAACWEPLAPHVGQCRRTMPFHLGQLPDIGRASGSGPR
jgi:hypothetical protein